MPTLPAKIISHARTAGWLDYTLSIRSIALWTLQLLLLLLNIPSPNLTLPHPPYFLCLCLSRDNKQYFMAHQICNKLFRHSSKTIHHAANATCRSMQHLHVHPGSNCDSFSQLLLLLRGHLPRLTAPMSASISQKTELTLELACGAALWSASEHCRLYWGANNWSELNKFCSTTFADCAAHLCSQMETTQTDKNTKFSSCQYHVTTVITVLCRHYIDTHISSIGQVC